MSNPLCFDLTADTTDYTADSDEITADQTEVCGIAMESETVFRVSRPIDFVLHGRYLAPPRPFFAKAQKPRKGNEMAELMELYAHWKAMA